MANRITVTTGWEMLDLNTRFYDPQVGRWFTPDPADQFHNPYLAMGNNPVMYVDPDGEFAFLIPFLIGAGISVFTNGISNSIDGGKFFDGAGRAALIGGVTGVLSAGIGSAAGGMMGVEKVAFQTLMHGHLGGMTSAVTGGKYTAGFLAGASGSIAANATEIATLNIENKFAYGAAIVGSGAITGGIGAEIAGGNFWDGVRTGAISSGLNHLAHRAFKEPTDPPKKDKRYGSPYAETEEPFIPGPYEGPGSNWANFKAIGSSLDSFLHGAEGFETIMYLTKKSLNVALSKKASGMMMTRDLSPKIPGATMFPFNTPGLELILQGSYIGPYNNNYQVPYN